MDVFVELIVQVNVGEGRRCLGRLDEARVLEEGVAPFGHLLERELDLGFRLVDVRQVLVLEVGDAGAVGPGDGALAPSHQRLLFVLAGKEGRYGLEF